MGEGDDQGEIRLKLVVDDQSEAVARAVREGFEAVKKTLEDVQKVSETAGHAAGEAMGGAAKHAEGAKEKTESLWKEIFKAEVALEAVKKGAEIVGEAFEQGVEFAHHLAEASLEAAQAQEEQERQMAGFLLLMDSGKHSMQDLRAYTDDMREEFARFGREGGYATKELVGAFNALERSGTLGSERAKELTEHMAQVGRVIPGGIDALAQGFNHLERGIASTRNPIVQLIATMDPLHRNAQAMSHAMKNMTPEAQMKLGEQAIARQAKLLEEMGANIPDLAHLETSFEGTKEAFFEAMGKPALDALIPHLTALRNFLNEHAEQIEEIGGKIGQQFANLIDMVDAAAEGLYEGIHQNWDEISGEFQVLFGDWENAWESATGHTADIKKDFETIALAITHAMLDVASIIKAAMEVAMDAWDLVHGDAAGTSQAEIQRKSTYQEALNATSDTGSKGFDEAAEKYRQLALEANQNEAQIDAHIASMREAMQANMASAANAGEALERGEYDKFNTYLQDAINVHSEGAEKYALSLISESEQAKHALIDGAIHIEGGMEALKKLIAEQSPELAKALAEMLNPIKAHGGIKPAALTQNFHGGIHIKQDFKDMDPERVMITFRRDLAQAAAARTSSLVRGNGGFG